MAMQAKGAVSMTSDIDELLASLRENEYWLRRLSAGDSSAHAERELEKADKAARWIAEVEELVTFKANHSGSRGHDVTDLYEEPADGDPTES